MLLTQAVLLRCNLEEEESRPLLQLFSVQSCGLSGIIYYGGRVRQIFTVTQCARVYPACKEERERERRVGRNTSDRTTADREGAKKKKGSWMAVSAGGRRGGGWAVLLILHHKHHSTFLFWTSEDKRAQKCVRVWLLKAWVSTFTGLCLSWSGASTESAPQTPSMTCFIWWDICLPAFAAAASVTAVVFVGVLAGGRHSLHLFLFAWSPISGFWRQEALSHCYGAELPCNWLSATQDNREIKLYMQQGILLRSHPSWCLSVSDHIILSVLFIFHLRPQKKTISCCILWFILWGWLPRFSGAPFSPSCHDSPCTQTCKGVNSPSAWWLLQGCDCSPNQTKMCMKNKVQNIVL